MQYRILGRTRLNVSMISLGTGGHSRIGQSTGKTAQQSINVIRTALDAGINLIDSSEIYGTEELVGQALNGTVRSDIIISSKAGIHLENKLKSAAQLKESLKGSLKRLQTDYIDIYHLHAVRYEDYAYVCQELVPALLDLKKEGSIRSIGITEQFAADPGHKMLRQAVLDDFWDVMMVGFNLLNQSARARVLEPAKVKDIGTLDMFAVRRVLISSDTLVPLLEQLIAQQLLDPASIDLEDPLGQQIRGSGCASLTELAYRFCAGESVLDSILCGTGSPQHLSQNIQDILKGPLDEQVHAQLRELFSQVDSVSAN